jgi:hypothetical protein
MTQRLGTGDIGGSHDDNAAMSKVIFLKVSLDGQIETPDHSLDWTINDDELRNASWPTAESDPAARRCLPRVRGPLLVPSEQIARHAR